MSPAFKTGRRSALLARQLKRSRRRRRALVILALIVLVPGLLFLLDYYLERSLEIPREPSRRAEAEEADFDPQLVYTKARALLEAGRANMHRGRREMVRGQFEESLELMLMLREQTPEYRPARVRRDIETLRGLLRQVR